MKHTTVPRRSIESKASTLTATEFSKLQWHVREIQLGIARRAYELFEMRGGEHGHDWEDWFQAESELLHPVSVALSESPTGLAVRANVLGFEEGELEVAVEPRQIIVVGQKALMTSGRSAKPANADWSPDLILHVIHLPVEIDPEGAVIEFQTGMLKFELPKAKAQVDALRAA